MQDQRLIYLLTYMVAVAIPVSLPFNIETTNPTVYTGEQQDFFGYKVLQYKDSDSKKGIIITAPLQLNGSGGVCSNDQTSQCFRPQDIHLTNQTIPVKHLGLTIAANSGSQFTVCSPNVAHECYENSYLNSVCYKITHNLTEVSNFTPSFQECRKKTVDLVFLFDGSASMTEAEFNKNKDFIVDIINSIKNSSIKFAAVQFSTDYKKVFDFNEYQAGIALSKLQIEPHMKSLTNTHKALKFVLEDILENPGAGASPDSTKVLVLITDGDPSDTDRHGIIKRYDEKNIIRFVIAVKGAKLDKFHNIASRPTDNYAFKIEDYDGLTGILENFQKKIFKMEGTKVSLAEDMTNEMSQSGFSVAVYDVSSLDKDKDSLILGSVGSNFWRGSLEERTSTNMIQIRDPDMLIESYMGYSVSVGKKRNMALYFTGAPRFNHTGQVVLFTRNNGKWTPVHRKNGSQIGSYFGAELCSVDIDSDKDTDFLLVGAPLFYHHNEKREGQIYVYTVTDEMELNSELNVTVSSMGRFGTTISSIADLNGDELRDIAVGAPLEDENSGAVYIYLGDRHTGIRSTFSQKIIGREIKSGLRFFGQSIDGNFDMGEDELPDIVIGSKGSAVVLRSKPVFNVMPYLGFRPEEIKIDEIECPLKTKDSILPMVNLTVCFEMTEKTKSKQAASTGLNISFTLDVDPTRQTHRGFFNKDTKARNLAMVYELRNKDSCFDYTIYMLKCVENTLSPISIKLNFIQIESENATAVLNVDSKKMAVVEIPFEKQCIKNDQCIADLVVDFNFTTPTLLVAEEKYFTVSVQLSNLGEVSYNTSLTIDYPDGLSFSKMELTRATRPTVHNCYDQEGVLNRTVCGVSLPVYRSKSSTTFKTFFHIMTSKNKREHEWDDTISMTFSGTSNNANATSLSSMTKNITVQYEIQLAVTLNEDNINFLNFTTEESTPKILEIRYTIANPGWKSFPVNVSLVFLPELDYNFEMKNYKVSVGKNKTQCNDIQPSSCFFRKPSKIIRCETFVLEKESMIEITFSGDVQFKTLKDYAANLAFLKRFSGDGAEVKFQSFIQVDYDKQRYVLNTNKQEKKSNEMCLDTDSTPTVKGAEVRVEFIVPMDRKLIVLTGVGLGLLLLIIFTVIMFKMGCFKRRTLPTEEDSVDFQACTSAPLTEASATAPTEDTVSQPNTDSKSEQPSENNKLLDNNKTNGSN